MALNTNQSFFFVSETFKIGHGMIDSGADCNLMYAEIFLIVYAYGNNKLLETVGSC